MKFINLSLVALGCSLALGKPLTNKVQCDKKLCYWISSSTGGNAYVSGLANENKNAKSISIPSVVTFEGYRFNVIGTIMGALSGNSNLEEINVASGINNLDLSNDVFANCSNLKRVVLSNKSISAVNLTPFSNPSLNIVFYGRATKSLVDNQAPKLLDRWNISKKNYNSETQMTRKTDLFNLGKYMNYYILVNDNSRYDSAAVSIKTSRASHSGYARTYRFLAMAMGIPKNNILVATDGNNHYWNLVKVDGKWYNADMINYPFPSVRNYEMAEDKRPLFLNNSKFKEQLASNYSNTNTNPSQWSVVLNMYGYPDEFNGQQTTERIDTYLSQNGLGSRA